MMKKDFKLEQFSGPLDLLLSLIQEKKLDISEVAISEVTEQYLEYLDTLEENRAEELADFLVIASKLLLFKSNLLLPQFVPEEDEGPSLEDQLRLYKMFVERSKDINNLWLNENRGFFRIEPLRKAKEFVPPTNLVLEKMHESMLQLVNRIAPPKELPQARIDKAVSVKEKIDSIRMLLRKSKSFSFREVLQSSQNKTEVIVGFLAMLELVKQRMIGLRQQESFGDIVIERV